MVLKIAVLFRRFSLKPFAILPPLAENRHRTQYDISDGMLQGQLTMNRSDAGQHSGLSALLVPAFFRVVKVFFNFGKM